MHMAMIKVIGYELGIGLFVCQENVVQKSYFMGKGAMGFQSGAIANPIIDVTERGGAAPPRLPHVIWWIRWRIFSFILGNIRSNH